MAGKDYKIGIDLDARNAQRDLKKLADTTGDTEEALEDVESAGERMARAISQSADDLESELEASERAAEALAREMEDVDNFKAQEAVGQLKRLGLTAEDIEADAEQLADALKQVDKVNLKAVNAGFDDMRTNAVGVPEDIDGIRRKGEGLQSAIPALRGFSDELGGGAAQAGIYSQAVADLGDFSLIMGEQLGISEAATAKLGTALGAAGLAGVVIGMALPAIQLLTKGNEKAEKRMEELTEAVREQLGLFDEFEEQQTALQDSLIKDEDLEKVAIAMGHLNKQMDESDEVLTEVAKDAEAFFKEQLLLAGASEEVADKLAPLIASTDSYNDAIQKLGQGNLRGVTKETREWLDSNRDIYDSLEILQDQVEDADFAEALSEQLAILRSTDPEGLQAVVDALAELDTDAEPVERYATALNVLDQRAAEAAESTDEVADSSDDAASAQERAQEAAQEAADAYMAEAEAAQAVADAQASLAERTYSVQEAQYAFVDALAENAPILAEAEQGSREYNEAQIAIAESAQSVADAQVEIALGYAEASGETLSAAESTDIANRSLLQQASTLNGPERSAIMRHIGLINGIPTDVLTEIEAALDRGDIDTANRLLAETSRTRSAQINANANTRNAERALNDAARDRVTRIFPVVGGASYGVGGIPRRAEGGPVSGNEPYLVGEDGPELITPNRYGYVHDADETAKMIGPEGSRKTTTVNNYTTYHFRAGVRADNVARARRKYDRIQGPI